MFERIENVHGRHYYKVIYNHLEQLLLEEDTTHLWDGTTQFELTLKPQRF